MNAYLAGLFDAMEDFHDEGVVGVAQFGPVLVEEFARGGEEAVPNVSQLVLDQGLLRFLWWRACEPLGNCAFRAKRSRNRASPGTRCRCSCDRTRR